MSSETQPIPNATAVQNRPPRFYTKPPKDGLAPNDLLVTDITIAGQRVVVANVLAALRIGEVPKTRRGPPSFQTPNGNH